MFKNYFPAIKVLLFDYKDQLMVVKRYKVKINFTKKIFEVGGFQLTREISKDEMSLEMAAFV